VADVGSERLLVLLAGTENGLAVVRRICELCVLELAVSGAGVSVMGGGPAADGSQVLVHATGDVSVQLESLQLTVGEGPSVDAYTLGGPVLVPDLAIENARWPVFTAGAVELGVAAVFSFPLQVGAARMGVLDLHRGTPGPLTAGQLTDAFTLVGASTVALLDDVEAPQTGGPSWLGDLHDGVHQATGIVTVQLGVTLSDALLRIRAHAYAHQLTLNEVGRQIVERELRLEMEE
jgi:hypothetical protein